MTLMNRDFNCICMLVGTHFSHINLQQASPLAHPGIPVCVRKWFSPTHSLCELNGALCYQEEGFAQL